MANQRELAQSILGALTLVQNASDELLETPGVLEVLREMDDMADELREVLA